MDLRTRDYGEADRLRLAEALIARRVAISPAYANRAEFIRASGLNKKLVERLETGHPGNYRTSTLALVARAYEVTLDSVSAPLHGGQLAPAAGSPGSDDEPAGPFPECEFERRILALDAISDDQKKQIIVAHRAEGHAWCGTPQTGTTRAEPALAVRLPEAGHAAAG